MEKTARLYYCALCRTQVIICSDCDRGNIYCLNGCAQHARQSSLKTAGKRYQNTFNGRCRHAARQQRYRARQEKVTHQGSQTVSLDSCFQPTNIVLKTDKTVHHSATHGHCHCCQQSVSAFLRADYLHQCTIKVDRMHGIAIRGP